MDLIYAMTCITEASARQAKVDSKIRRALEQQQQKQPT
jgi:hypothetical protein